MARLPYEQQVEQVQAYASDRGIPVSEAYWLLLEDPHGPPPSNLATLPPERQAAHVMWHARAHRMTFVEACRALRIS